MFGNEQGNNKYDREDFYDAVDEYFEFCAECGKEPQQQYKGSFNVRISPDLHRKASLGTSVKNVSLNSYVEYAIEMQVAKDVVMM